MEMQRSRTHPGSYNRECLFCIRKRQVLSPWKTFQGIPLPWQKALTDYASDGSNMKNSTLWRSSTYHCTRSGWNKTSLGVRRHPIAIVLWVMTHDHVFLRKIYHLAGKVLRKCFQKHHLFRHKAWSKVTEKVRCHTFRNRGSTNTTQQCSGKHHVTAHAIVGFIKL